MSNGCDRNTQTTFRNLMRSELDRAAYMLMTVRWILMSSVELGQMVSTSKYRGIARYRYQTFKVSKYRPTTGSLTFNTIPGQRG